MQNWSVFWRVLNAAQDFFAHFAFVCAILMPILLHEIKQKLGKRKKVKSAFWTFLLLFNLELLHHPIEFVMDMLRPFPLTTNLLIIWSYPLQTWYHWHILLLNNIVLRPWSLSCRFSPILNFGLVLNDVQSNLERLFLILFEILFLLEKTTFTILDP